MKHHHLPTIAIATLALLLTANASESLVIRGTGTRTKPILGTLYQLTLYVPESLQTADAPTLLTADQPMTLHLTLKSTLINRKRFVETTTEGFAKAAASGYSSPNTPAFLDQFAQTQFKKGDTIIMHYANNTLTTLYRAADGTEAPLGAIPGLDLKQALFAIWLGTTPAQQSLKTALLTPRP